MLEQKAIVAVIITKTQVQIPRTAFNQFFVLMVEVSATVISYIFYHFPKLSDPRYLPTQLPVVCNQPFLRQKLYSAQSEALRSLLLQPRELREYPEH